MKRAKKVEWLIFVFAILGFVGTHYALGEPIWEPSTPSLQTARTGPGVTIGPDGAIYAIGGEGRNPKEPLKTAEKWYEGQAAWQSIKPMNVERHIAGVVTDSFGNIWATGGYTTGGSVLDTVEIYDPASDTWQSGPPMNEDRTGHGVATDSDGCIYVFGGRDTLLEATSSVEKYDPLTGQWSYISSLNEARICMGVAVDQQGRIYAIGGSTYSQGLGQLLKTVEVYDPANPIPGWQYVADIPTVVGYGAAFVHEGEIWLVGGNSTYSYWTNDCYIYSPNTNSWRTGPTMYEILCLAGATVGPSGTTYLIGGERGGGSVASDHVAMLAPEPEALTGRIAFISDRDGNEEIYLMNVDGSNQIRLTNDPGVDASPIFSPDGRTIAFISNRSGSHRIYTMLWNGGELHEVPNSECFLGYTNYCRVLAWSPDSQKLLFEPTYDSLATINLDGSGKTILLTGGVDGHDLIWGPEWGPTMDDIYFNAQVFHWGYDQHIFHYSISGNNWTQITLDVEPMLSAGPKVSRGTSRIVFFRQQGWQGPENIFTMDLDGSNESQITFDEDTTLKNRTPDWCGETGEIVFWSNKSGGAQVWLMDSTGGNLRMLEGEGNNYAPSWTPISEPVEPDIDVSPLSHDFGDVELGTSRTVIVTISNVGNGDLTVSGIGLETDFAITSAPDSAIVVEPSQTADVEITYTPSVLGYNSAVLKITSDDPDEPVVEVQLSAVGIEIPLPPLEQIANILAFFDTSVDDGTLLGDGPGNSAEKRLNALRNMIEASGDLIENELFEEACQQLLDAYRRMDGQPKPPDFVTGEAVTELATMIQELMTTLGC